MRVVLVLVLVVVVVAAAAAAAVLVVVVSSLSGHNIALGMKPTTKLWLYEFTLGWDAD